MFLRQKQFLQKWKNRNGRNCRMHSESCAYDTHEMGRFHNWYQIPRIWPECNSMAGNCISEWQRSRCSLKGYEKELLASVGLDGSNGKIKNTYYTSDSYTNENGVVCRNAQADIQKLVPVYRAEYIGEMNTPHVIQTAVYEGNRK